MFNENEECKLPSVSFIYIVFSVKYKKKKSDCVNCLSV